MNRTRTITTEKSSIKESHRTAVTLLFLIYAFVASVLSSSLVVSSLLPTEQSLSSMFENGIPWDVTARQQQQQPPLELYGKPTNDNTLITLIAMGLKDDMYLTERCVRSIRARGNFTGYIMIFTDDKGYTKYNHTLYWDNKIVLMKGNSEDKHPKKPEDGSRIKYSKHTMKYKRYKTLSTKYLQYDPRLSTTVQYILYLDIDNVVANPLSTFFNDYQRKINQEYATANVEGLSGHSLISFWVDPVLVRRTQELPTLQGGQFMVERYHGQKCLDAWRNEMDTVRSDFDQTLLMRVTEQFDKYRCLVSLLPSKKNHFDLLQDHVLNESDPDRYPTIVHISGHRARIFPEEKQRKFLRKALELDEDPTTISSSSYMVEDVPWEKVIQPVGVKGQKPEQP
jgi:hypothetical protein